MDAPQTPDIFVSYARDDRERAATLVAGLKAEGWSVWWDPELVGGTRFDRAIEEALNVAKCVVVIWSPASVESDFVFDEARTAVQRKVMIPVVIGKAKAPLGFGRVQSVDLDSPDGVDRLKQAVRARLNQPVTERPRRKRSRYVLGAAAAAIVAVIAIWWLGPSYEDQFRHLRAQTAATPPSRSEAMVGVTVWRLRPSIPTDPPYTRMLTEPPVDGASPAAAAEWTPVRVRADADLPEGSKVRLGVESSREGYVYIVDRELGADGSAGPPKIVYPTDRTRGGGDRVRFGELLQLPSPAAAVQYWELKATRPNYAGELLTIIVSPQRITELDNAETLVSEQRVDKWQKEWGAGVQRVFTGPQGALLTAGEALARTNPLHVLTQNDAGPSAIYSRGAPLDVPMLVSHAIKIAFLKPVPSR